MEEQLTASPHAIFVDHARRNELAYQVSAEDGAAVFHPRLIAPGSGAALEWRVSRGLGTVHATTVVSMKGEMPYNLALIDMDEGFRMLSRVEDIAPEMVGIGMRVTARFVPGEGDEPSYPVFVPLGETA